MVRLKLVVNNDTKSIPPLEKCSDIDGEEPVHGDFLVTRRVLSIQPKNREDDE